MARALLFVPLLASLLSLTTRAGAQTPALRTKTRIVILDVGVSDSHGNPVKDLNASDFALTESDRPQTISHFEAYSSLSPAAAAQLPQTPKLEPNIFTNYTLAPPDGVLNVLLFDALNTPLRDQTRVRSQMLKYLDTPHPGACIAIFTLDPTLRLLQGFTSDPEVLRDALNSKRALPQPSPMMDNSVDGDQPGADTWIDHVTMPPSSPTIPSSLTTGERERVYAQLADRTRSTLQAMNGLAHYLSGLPGRKNLVWFSGSFPLTSSMSDLNEQFRQTTVLLAHSQIAVYPIDASSLQAQPVSDPKGTFGRTPSSRAFYQKSDAEQFTMKQMAEDTGGETFVNNNNLAAAVEKAIDDGSNFYRLTYTPANRDWKGEFRKVQVQLAGKRYTLSYRPGYYADDGDTPEANGEPKDASAGEAGTPAAKPARAAMRSALQYGSPQPSGVVFKASVNPATGTSESAIARGNVSGPKISGPFERYIIDIAALPAAFTFTRIGPDKIHVAAELSTHVYNAGGTLLNLATVRAERNIDDAQYVEIMRSGLKFRQEISVPVKGENFLRIGVEDLVSSRVGAVEIPVATLAKFKPIAIPGAASTPK